MRLVKKTVNQDDVSVYHLFYGDEKNPGTELTFFEIPMAGRTREETTASRQHPFACPVTALWNIGPSGWMNMG